MSWEVEFIEDAQKDMRKLDNSSRVLVYKAIDKVGKNPTENGYGKPLGSKSGSNLTSLIKIKLKGSGIRVVYKLEIADDVMKIIVVAARADDQVYKEAVRRRRKHNL